MAVHTQPRAASSPICPLFQKSNRATATTCESGPTRRSINDTARTASRNTKSQHEIIAGTSSGKTTRKKDPTCPAPAMAAASSKSGKFGTPQGGASTKAVRDISNRRYDNERKQAPINLSTGMDKDFQK